MSVNLELLNDTLAIIKADPKKYNQEQWVAKNEYSPCGTTMCFAGHAAVLAGAENPDPKKHVIDDWYVALDENRSYLNWSAVRPHMQPGPYQSVQEFARDALGISEAESNYLFDATRSMGDIEEAVHDLNEYGSIQDMDYNDDYDYRCDCGCEFDYDDDEDED